MDKNALFGQLFHANYERLHRYAYTLLQDSHEANDVVQSVFTSLWEKDAGILLEDEIRSYLYKSVYHLCLNLMRKEKSRKKYIRFSEHHNRDTSQGGADHSALEHELHARIAKATVQLPPQCRTIFLKSREEGKKYAEIAMELELSVKTVEAQMSKALRILREKLAEYLVMLIVLFMS